jgi:hypothetical protein
MKITFKRKELALLIDALDLLQILDAAAHRSKLRQVRFKLKRAFDSEKGIII